MYLPFIASGARNRWGDMASLAGTALSKRNSTSNGSITITELRSQWSNPSDVSTILMIIGGDVVRGALAQSTGTWFTPVCFSFGWVSYAFIALLHVIGDGRLLPEADYPVRLINLKSGYARDNKNWVIGRLLRDGESYVEKKKPLDDNGIRISVFEATKRQTGDHKTKFQFDRSHLYGLAVMIAQLTIASVPVILDREWGVLFITGAGTLLAQLAGALPQWRAEKLPNRQHSSEIYALTTGNGAKDVMVILGRGQCLDLEEFSVSDTPRNGRPWEKFRAFSKPSKHPDGKFKFHRSGTQIRKSRAALGLPYGFWVTRVVSVLLSMLWLLLLINVASVKDSTWYLLLVGGIGMFQNGILAAMERPPGTRNIPLRRVEIITAKKVMDGLMDFEITYQCGRPLVDEFFPGELRGDEKEWWRNNPDPYDKEREENSTSRGVPRRYLPPIKSTSDPQRLNLDANPAPALDSSPTMTEKRVGDPFSDPETSNFSDIKASRRSPELHSGFLESSNREPRAKSESAITRIGGDQRVTSSNRSARARYPISIASTPEELQQSGSSSLPRPPRESNKSSLSAEEVRRTTGPPDWAG